MESIGIRIRKLRKDKKLTQKDLAKILGISDAAIVHWEKDVNIPKLEHLNILAPTLNTTIDYIMYGKSDTSDKVVDFRPITRMLPVLTYVQCGLMTNVRSISPHEIEKWLPAPPETGKNSFYLIAQGISNAPEFNDGDFICIDPDVPLEYVQTGEMIVVIQDDEATFKALVREHKTIYLKALNPNFQPNIIPLKENSIYRGKYTGKFTPSKKFL
ncbi:LexA family protein [Acinetobacter junii]|uniref:XRE family transcriptional regulator n=1 Tax=Acinetobacter junii TaxID=40215 RepID=A0ABU8ZCF9_ACIJU|nr:XRE family transcriptional regulator [Acinetobacter junii]APU48400.1 DNA-binding protein [Acinetobacter junii]MCE6003547.1 XRE family transcriptional regulator [Acinetobacter junii]MDH0718318.1 XRE family transcriptional regulator [Acinetobacter junii]MDR7654554.1 XRE family transcriptional regulator [Acinetobacter junii]MQZ56993.1 LexA family transcriptional regulator [Acinetobacter junii]